MGAFNVVAFCDQSVKPTSTIKALYRSTRSCPLLKTFLQQASSVMRLHRRLVQEHTAVEIRHFDSIFTLHEAASSGDADLLDTVTSSILTYIAEIGSLLTLLESAEHSLAHDQVHYFGLCTGTVAAAVAAAATSPEHLSTLATSLVPLVMRLGVAAERRRRQVDATPGSWAMVVRRAQYDTVLAELEAFHTAHLVSPHRRAYVSARGKTTVTVSGPPPTLALLLASRTALAELPHIALPITSPFHAPHLPSPDVDWILGDAAALERVPLRPNARICFAQQPVAAAAPSLGAALRHIVHACFQQQMDVQPGSLALDGATAPVRCASVGPGNLTDIVKSCLGEATLDGVHFDGSAPADSSNVDDPIVIVGMGGRFPSGESLDEFWSVLEQGKDVHEPIPADRFPNADAPYYGCFMKGAGDFDNTFFNLSPREAKQIDPTQRLLLMVTQEALEQSGYRGDQSHRIGTFFGQATDDWRESNAGGDIDIFYINGGMRAFAAGRLNYHYKWEGPSYGIDAACSSSLAAIEFAHRAIATGDCDVAIAGGGNLMSAPPMFAGLRAGGFTSKTGSCKTFDAGADGYCRGEGVGVVVLKRLSLARANRDRVLGVIRGIATNHSAYAASITRPHTPTQIALYKKTLELAAIDPDDIGYVELHGTGTTAGDTSEVSSVRDVFAAHRARPHPLYIGAVKANIGHGEAAAGVASVIKVLLMLQHKTIPPHCGIKTKYNPQLPNVEERNIHIPLDKTEWAAPAGPRKVMVNNFNATGGNTCMVIEEYVPPAEDDDREAPVLDERAHVVAVSAHRHVSLVKNLQRLHAYLDAHPAAALADVAYTANARRMHYDLRHAFVAKDTQSLKAAVAQALKAPDALVKSPRARAGFVFAGQGTHIFGIAQPLWASSEPFRASLAECARVATQAGFDDFLPLMLTPSDDKAPDAVQLQLGIVAIEYALASMWTSWGVAPAFVLGHSLGEYAALCVAGCISLSDMMFLVGTRAQLMVRQCTPGSHAMLSVQLSLAQLEPLIGGAPDKFSVCCQNAPNSTVVGGPVADLEALQAQLAAAGTRCKMLAVSYAFHSSMMDPILADLERLSQSIALRSPQVPFLSTLLGRVITEHDTFPDNYLARQCREPVQFYNALAAGLKAGVANADSLWIELGAGNPACLPLIRASGLDVNHKLLFSPLSSQKNCWESISQVLGQAYQAGAAIDWAAYYQHSPAQALDLPHYGFECKNFWIKTKPDAAAAALPAPAPQALPAAVPRVNACLHRVTALDKTPERVTASFESRLGDPELSKLVMGHFVLGSALCPSSVYSVAATTALEHASKTLDPARAVASIVEICDLVITRPLVVAPDSQSLLKVDLDAAPDFGSATVRVSEITSASSHQHGSCTLRQLPLAETTAQWARMQHLLHSRIQSLDASQSRDIFRLDRPVAYKLFENVVDYAEPYRVMQNIVLDTAAIEGYTNIELKTSGESDIERKIHFSDAFIHFVGFLLNHGIRDDGFAFISGGWESLRVNSAKLDGASYVAYAKLSPDSDNKIYSGDAFLMAGNEVVGSCYGVKFQRVKKAGLKTALERARGVVPTASTPAATVPAAAAAPAPPSVTVQTATASPPKPAGDAAYITIKAIIAKEAGLSVGEVADNSNPADLGLDSMLTTRVIEEIHAQLGISIPAGDFSELTEVVGIKKLLPQGSANAAPQVPPTPSTAQRQAIPVPGTQTPPGTPPDSDEAMDEAKVILDCMAAQTGASMADVEAAADFAEIGLDSILTVDVIDAMNKATGKSWPASFLQENRTAAAVRGALLQSKTLDITKTKAPASRAHLITGQPDSSRDLVFFMPPGSGSVGALFGLPGMPDKTAVYCLQSPFSENPDDTRFTFEAMVESFVRAVLETAGDKMVHLAGWSLGGVWAYETSRRLIQAGHRVGSLVLIDAPCPQGCPEDTPAFTIEQFASTGFLQLIVNSYGALPDKARRHMARSAANIQYINLTPMADDGVPLNTIVAWASLGDENMLLGQIGITRIAGADEHQKPVDASWLTKPKTSFVGAGWETKVGDGHYKLGVLEGDHMTIMEKKNIHRVTEMIFSSVQEARAKL